ncbi:uncharacterized protein PAC_10111 [Phialocephala subalpina]|uniref:Uncharacterized protein n=1 Tax=Phialocephala subalpina TaxID=576137 RepID=A0A1L7X5E0_9HELO|nr:uncharacterized protein PAC_10111 [Phialocephala subalpina]
MLNPSRDPMPAEQQFPTFVGVVESTEVYDFYGNSALADSLSQDDVLDLLPFAGPIGGQTLDSTLGGGTSETFPSLLVDAHTSLDNGFSLDDHEFFSFDDYTYPDFELALQAYGEIAVTSHSLQPSITHQPSLPSDLQSSGSSSTSSFPQIQDSSGSAVPTSSLVSSKSPSPASRSSPASATKLIISPSSFFRCPVC